MKAATFLIVTGFMLAFGAVGAIETDAPLLDSVLTAVVGLAIMGAGVLKLKHDAQVDTLG